MNQWPAPPAELAILSHEVHIWRVWLDKPAAEVQQLTQILSSDERSRAERFHFERDRRHFIVGRGQLRTILGRYLNLVPSQLQFCYGPRGKPALAATVSGGEAKLYFNLAHAAGLALYALTNEREIGVDLEQIHPIANMDQIIERFFSAQESAAYEPSLQSSGKRHFLIAGPVKRPI